MSHRLGPDLLQTDHSKEGTAVVHTGDDARNVVLGGAGMSLPFKAASLQQLADAALKSKRVSLLPSGGKAQAVVDLTGTCLVLCQNRQ